MGRVVRTALLLLAFAGCASRSGPAVYAPGAGRPLTDLALGPSRGHTVLAEMYASRSSWPSAWLGYLFDDVSTYTEVIYDDQSYYDPRGGGGFTREAVSVRTGVLIR